MLVLQFTGWAGVLIFFFPFLRSQLSSRHFQDYLCPLIPKNWLRALICLPISEMRHGPLRPCSLLMKKVAGGEPREGPGRRTGRSVLPPPLCPSTGQITEEPLLKRQLSADPKNHIKLAQNSFLLQTTGFFNQIQILAARCEFWRLLGLNLLTV